MKNKQKLLSFIKTGYPWSLIQIIIATPIVLYADKFGLPGVSTSLVIIAVMTLTYVITQAVPIYLRKDLRSYKELAGYAMTIALLTYFTQTLILSLIKLELIIPNFNLPNLLLAFITPIFFIFSRKKK